MMTEEATQETTEETTEKETRKPYDLRQHRQTFYVFNGRIKIELVTSEKENLDVDGGFQDVVYGCRISENIENNPKSITFDLDYRDCLAISKSFKLLANLF